jgi:glycosyltransferase involved in cell wall biosynthesis
LDHQLDGHHVQYASYIVRHLLESGDEVTFVAPRESPFLDELGRLFPAVDVRSALSPTRSLPRNALDRDRAILDTVRRGLRLARERRVDVFHHLYVDRSEVQLMIASLGRDRPYRAFGTLFWIQFDPEFLRTRKQRAAGGLRRLALRRLVAGNRLDGIFVHTGRVRDRLGELCGTQVSDACIVVPDPVPPPITVDQEASRRRLGLPLKGPIVLFFGGLRRDKGPDLLLQSLAHLRGKCIGVVAGQPMSVPEPEIRALASQLHDAAAVVLRLGWIPEEQIPHYFAASDIVAMPYRKSFLTTSGILTRAVSARKPIVVTDVGDVGHIVRDNGLGVVVQPDSPELFALGLSRVIEDLERYSNEVASRARAFAKIESWEVFAKTIRQVYVGTDAPKPAGLVQQ